MRHAPPASRIRRIPLSQSQLHLVDSDAPAIELPERRSARLRGIPAADRAQDVSIGSARHEDLEFTIEWAFCERTRTQVFCSRQELFEDHKPYLLNAHARRPHYHPAQDYSDAIAFLGVCKLEGEVMASLRFARAVDGEFRLQEGVIDVLKTTLYLTGAVLDDAYDAYCRKSRAPAARLEQPTADRALLAR
jgi:hypothetical protein